MHHRSLPYVNPKRQLPDNMGSEKLKHVVATGGGPQTDTASDPTCCCCYMDASIAHYHPLPQPRPGKHRRPLRLSPPPPRNPPHMLSPRQPQDGGQHRTTILGFLSYLFACVVLACGRRETSLCGVPRASGREGGFRRGGYSPHVLMRVQFSIDHFLLQSLSVQRDVTVCCLQGVSVTVNCIRSWRTFELRCDTEMTPRVLSPGMQHGHARRGRASLRPGRRRGGMACWHAVIHVLHIRWRSGWDRYLCIPRGGAYWQDHAKKKIEQWRICCFVQNMANPQLRHSAGRSVPAVKLASSHMLSAEAL